MKSKVAFSQKKVEDFFILQLSAWPEVKTRFELLADTMVKEFDIDGFKAKVQYNPNRKRSSAAKIDAVSIASRRCFLCDENRPSEQTSLNVAIENGECVEVDSDVRYKLLVNPFPICRFHLTIPADRHCPQLISGRIADMVAFANAMPELLIFYNGPRCGASAPDHFHFQAVGISELPIIQAIESGATIPYGVIVIEAVGDYSAEFERVKQLLPKFAGDDEPKFNLMCYRSANSVKIIIIPRRNHRPTFFGEGPGKMLISPASIDLGGVFVASRVEDFETFNADVIRELYRQLCYSQAEVDRFLHPAPTLAVGILESESVEIELLEGFEEIGRHAYTFEEINRLPNHRLSFAPTAVESRFRVNNVVIGKQFHWEQAESQEFSGAIELVAHDGIIAVVNHVDVETYLQSVISSEMSPTASLEFLKAHAVISRSWVLAQIENRKSAAKESGGSAKVTDEEIVRWYDHDDHSIYDVCADDHCQRYQGVTRQTCSRAVEAVEATRGEVLVSGNRLCDARFSKCCGGVMEEFESCWEDAHHPYLVARADSTTPDDFPDLTDETAAQQWIESRPDSFCNTTDNRILAQVLNNYDRSTTDFYRWTVEYSAEELSRLVREKSGIDFGEIVNLVPVKRGPSGRLIKLRIEGTKRSLTVGKELEIRRWLSPTHLYSSAFTVEKIFGEEGARFRLKGAGWGHGVGLCQIGAAVMGDRGYTYREILAHYYPNTILSTNYETGKQ